jgi:AcrR family transcriptional regulator
MPKIVDHDESRADFARAAWATIVEHGIDNATVRAVARTAGCSTGRLVHYFDSKEQLMLHAMRHAADRMTRRLRACRKDAQGLEALRAVLATTLPCSAARRDEWRFWLAFWGRATHEPLLAAELRRRQGAFRQVVLECLREAQRTGEVARDLDLKREVVVLDALLLGMGVVATTEPRILPAALQRQQLEACLAGLKRQPSAR